MRTKDAMAANEPMQARNQQLSRGEVNRRRYEANIKTKKKRTPPPTNEVVGERSKDEFH